MTDTTLFPDLPPAEPPGAATMNAAFDAWWPHVGPWIGPDVDPIDVAHEAYGAGWEAGRAQALNELAAELRDEGERQRSVRHGLNFAATIAEQKAAGK